jgi:hypothetical protein
MTLQASGVASSHDVYDALNKWQDIQVKVIQQLYNIYVLNELIVCTHKPF